MKLGQQLLFGILMCFCLVNISAQKIERHGGGYSQDGKLLKYKDVMVLLSTHAEAGPQFRSAKNMRDFSLVLEALGGAAFGYGLGNQLFNQNVFSNNPNNASSFMLIGGGIAITGLILNYTSTKRGKKAVQLFNSDNGYSYRKKSNLRFQYYGNAIGLVLNF